MNNYLVTVDIEKAVGTLNNSFLPVVLGDTSSGN